jgi:hypothetical protein
MMASSMGSKTVSIRTYIQHNSKKETFYAYAGVMTSLHVHQPHPTLILARGFLYFVTFVSVYIIPGSHMCHIDVLYICVTVVSQLSQVSITFTSICVTNTIFVTLLSHLRHNCVTFLSHLHHMCITFLSQLHHIFESQIDHMCINMSLCDENLMHKCVCATFVLQLRHTCCFTYVSHMHHIMQMRQIFITYG